MIKLGYLEGYSALNVPKYNTASARDTAFDNLATYTIDAYYPPYYTNVIKLDINEVPLTSPINFVILVHNNKYYYYFADKVKYINEEIYELIINMDTVLTHMFDYKVKQGIITRKSIPRWIDNNINRNYVRENISEGYMDIENYDEKSANKYVVVCSSHWYREGVTPFYTNITKGYNIFESEYYIYIIPIPPDNIMSSGSYVNVTSNYITTAISCEYQDLLVDLISDPYTLKMYYIESEFLDNLLKPTWSFATTSTLNLALDYGLRDSNIMKINSNNVYTLAFCLNEINIDFIISDTISFNFEKNTNVSTLFDIKYIPQLMDENYIQIEYGDITSFVSYPLHLSNKPSLYAKTSFDAVSGNTIYYITDIINDDNRFKTANVSMPVTFELLTDAWKDYQARNKASLTTGLQLQFVNTMYSTVKSYMTKGIGNSISNSKVSQFTKKGRISQQYYSNQIDQQEQAVEMSGFVSDGLMQGANIVANYKINKENLEYTPDTIRGVGDVYTNFIDEYKKPYIKKYYVSDIVACGKKLEEFGYIVNEIVNTSTYMQDLCNIRTYYNCVNARVTLYETTCLIANDIINDINARLENGLRFINMGMITSTTKIPDIFNYDNVEIS